MSDNITITINAIPPILSALLLAIATVVTAAMVYMMFRKMRDEKEPELASRKIIATSVAIIVMISASLGLNYVTRNEVKNALGGKEIVEVTTPLAFVCTIRDGYIVIEDQGMNKIFKAHGEKSKEGFTKCNINLSRTPTKPVGSGDRL